MYKCIVWSDAQRDICGTSLTLFGPFFSSIGGNFDPCHGNCLVWSDATVRLGRTLVVTFVTLSFAPAPALPLSVGKGCRSLGRALRRLPPVFWVIPFARQFVGHITSEVGEAILRSGALLFLLRVVSDFYRLDEPRVLKAAENFASGVLVARYEPGEAARRHSQSPVVGPVVQLGNLDAAAPFVRCKRVPRMRPEQFVVQRTKRGTPLRLRLPGIYARPPLAEGKIARHRTTPATAHAD
jgi:hypothetical protein